jgi:hypothetical protein
MARKVYSQREARRLARRVRQLENFLAGYGTEVARYNFGKEHITFQKVRTARQLEHPVIVVCDDEKGHLVFRGLPQIPTVE